MARGAGGAEAARYSAREKRPGAAVGTAEAQGLRPEPSGAGFPKAKRLRKRAEFVALANRSKKPELKIHSSCFLILGRKNGLAHSRLGVTVTKKIGGAVLRNHLKRRVRELFRLNGRFWPQGLDILFIAKARAAEASAAELREALAEADRGLTASSHPSAQSGPAEPLSPAASEGSKESSRPTPFGRGALTAPLDFLQWALGRLALGFIFIYQRGVSPWLPPVCRFYPSCSHYAASAIKIHGFWRGSYLGARRLLRCHPLNPGGYDPVPPKKDSGLPL